MSRRRVIRDSDEEDEALSPIQSLPKKNVLDEQVLHSKNRSSNTTGTSSTDPVLFQNFYNQQVRDVLGETPEGPPNSAQLAVLQDHIINQTMSSSPLNNPNIQLNAPMTATRLKRRRTTDPSSLTLATSPLAQRAKRNKSNPKDMDKLTQVTSPGKQGRTQETDIWEFMGSSDSKPQPLKATRPPKETPKETKTYGKLRRSNTSVGYSQSSLLDTQSPERSVPRDDHEAIAQTPSSSVEGIQEPSEPAIPKEKKTSGKLKRARTSGYDRSSNSNLEIYEDPVSRDNATAAQAMVISSSTEEPSRLTVPKEKKSNTKLKRSKTLMNTRSSQSDVYEHEKSKSKDDSHDFGRKRKASHSEDAGEGLLASQAKKQKQTLRSRGRSLVELDDSSNIVNDPVINDLSSSDATKIQVPRTAEDATAKLTGSSLAENNSAIKSPHEQQGSTAVFDGTSKSSISVIPATLSYSQKMTYETMSIASTNQECRSSIAEAVLDPHGIGASADLIQEALLTEAESGDPEAPKKNVPPSPPVLPAKRKMKRAKSSSGVDVGLVGSDAPVLSSTSMASTAAPKKKRRKTVADVHSSQVSVDELSYTQSQGLAKSTAGKETSKEPRRKAAQNSEERMSVEELFNSDDIGISTEKYQPRPTRRRSKSTGIDPLAADASDVVAGLSATTARRKSTRATKRIQDTASEESSTVHSKIIAATTESNELTGHDIDNFREHENTDFAGSVPETQEMGGTNVFGSLVDDTIVPNTGFLARTTEVDASTVPNTIETPIITASSAAPERRGRPPNALAATLNADSTVKVVTEDVSPADESPDFTGTLVDPAPKTKAPVKRRGRPPKSTEMVVEDVEEVDVLSDKGSCNKGNFSYPRNMRQEKGIEEQPENEVTESTWSQPADFLVPKSTPPQPAETTEALPLVTPTKGIRKGPVHSPLPNSKVPYRVGLSKNHKIAPLLRMIKK